MHTNKLAHTDRFVGGNSVNIYSPFQSWAPRMKCQLKEETNLKDKQGPVVSFIKTSSFFLKSLKHLKLETFICSAGVTGAFTTSDVACFPI